ncbi:MAG: hypothetical protein QOG53_1175 [Frankiales bacterium]|nr:hypothetical protein [Frankiales bacterium]
MRWQELFSDLDGQFDAAEAAELAAEVSDRTRRELARVRLVDRMRAAIGDSVVVGVPHRDSLHGQITGVGPDWLLLTEPAGREALVPVSAVTTMTGLGPKADDPGAEGEVAARLGLRYALRVLARDRTALVITLADGRSLTGTLDRVGADFVDLAEHPADDARRGPKRAVTVPFSAIVVIRSA